MSKSIDDIVNDTLRNDAQKNAIDFIAYLRGDEGFSFSKDDNDDGRWWINYRDIFVCEIQIETSGDAHEKWDVWFYGDCIGRHDSPVDDTIKEIAWANMTLCRNCGADCATGKHKTVFGKEFNNVCQSTMAFPNPKTDMLGCMKKIINVMKNDIKNNRYM